VKRRYVPVHPDRPALPLQECLTTVCCRCAIMLCTVADPYQGMAPGITTERLHVCAAESYGIAAHCAAIRHRRFFPSRGRCRTCPVRCVTIANLILRCCWCCGTASGDSPSGRSHRRRHGAMLIPGGPDAIHRLPRRGLCLGRNIPEIRERNRR